MSELAGAVITIMGMIFTAGAIYGAIRAEIRSGHEKAERAQKTADEAHARLDKHLEHC